MAELLYARLLTTTSGRVPVWHRVRPAPWRDDCYQSACFGVLLARRVELSPERPGASGPVCLNCTDHGLGAWTVADRGGR